MFLKSIRIFGFKSFAEVTLIEFRSPLNAVVGPNGCGKSNIIDAFRWVLGEQNPRNLRVSRMEDLIFAGSDTRPALNVADVAITFDNTQSLLKFDAPEICVRRRLFRSGESEFLLNNVSVRLRDIRELFYDTGIGKLAYSVLEQGGIDKILSDKPEDRRSYFEEASGITGYRIRWQESQQNLRNSQQNFTEITRRVSDMQKRINVLKGQADRVVEYRKHKTSLFEVEAQLDLHLLKRVDRQIRVQADKKEDITNQIAGLQRKNKEIDYLQNTSITELHSLHQKQLEFQQQISEDQVIHARRSGHHELLRQRLTDNTEKLRQLVHQQSESDQVCKQLEEKILKVDRQLEPLKKEAEKITGQMEEKEKQQIHMEEEIRQLVTSVGEQRKKSQQLLSQQHDLHTEITLLAEKLIRSLDEALQAYQNENTLAMEQDIDALLREIRKKMEIPMGEHAVPSELRKLLDALEEKIYKTKTPDILHGLLAPEGIITHKRAIDVQMENIIKEQHSLQALQSFLQEQLQEKQGELKTLRSQIVKDRLRISHVSRELQKQKDARNVLYLRQQKQEHHFATFKEQMREINQLSKNIAAEIEASSKVENTSRIKELQEHQKDIRKQIENKERELQNLRKEEGLQREGEGKLRKKHESLEVELAQLGTQVKNVKETFFQRHGLTLNDYQRSDVSPEELQREQARLLQDIREIGNVNFLASEEFEALDTEYQEFLIHKDDLEKAIADLHSIIDHAYKEAEERFLDTFKRIQERFAHIFFQFFIGGNAKLYLEDSSCPLESGIGIIVQPPGMKSVGIRQLSGGERTLSAVALLFATYMIHSAPFCILDEVDAMLDEKNIQLFIRILRDFTDKSQFIIITHNIQTTSSMESVIGVTMEEPGISKLVTVLLKEGSRVT